MPRSEKGIMMNPLEFQMEMSKKMFSEWEKNMGEYFDKTLRDQGFLKLVSQSLSQSMDFQGEIQKQMGTVLKAFSIPTEESLQGLYKSVNNLERRMLDLEEKIENLEETLAQKSEKARGKSE